MNSPQVTGAPGRRQGLFDAGVSVVGGAATGIAMFILNIVAARTLSRADFAQISFALVLGQICMALAIVGLDVATSRTIGHARQKAEAICSTAVAMACVSALTLGLLILAAAPALGGVLGVDTLVVVLSGVVGVLLGIRLLAERMCAALGLIRQQLFIKLVEATLLIGLAVLAFSSLRSDWRGGILAVGAAALVAVTMYGVAMRSRLRVRSIDREAAKLLSPYARYAFLSSLLIAALTYADKLVLMRGAGPDDYAVYAAYYAGTIVVAGQAIIVLQNVLIPRAADTRLRQAMLYELRRAQWLALPGLAVVGAAVLAAVLLLFGPNFPIEGDRFALFVGWWVLFLRNAVLATILIASSHEAYRSELAFIVVRVAATFTIFAALTLLDRVSFISIVATMIVVEIAETMNLRRLQRRYLDRDVAVTVDPTFDASKDARSER